MLASSYTPYRPTVPVSCPCWFRIGPVPSLVSVRVRTTNTKHSANGLPCRASSFRSLGSAPIVGIGLSVLCSRLTLAPSVPAWPCVLQRFGAPQHHDEELGEIPGAYHQPVQAAESTITRSTPDSAGPVWIHSLVSAAMLYIELEHLFCLLHPPDFCSHLHCFLVGPGKQKRLHGTGSDF